MIKKFLQIGFIISWKTCKHLKCHFKVLCPHCSCVRSMSNIWWEKWAGSKLSLIFWYMFIYVKGSFFGHVQVDITNEVVLGYVFACMMACDFIFIKNKNMEIIICVCICVMCEFSHSINCHSNWNNEHYVIFTPFYKMCLEEQTLMCNDSHFNYNCKLQQPIYFIMKKMT